MDAGDAWGRSSSSSSSAAAAARRLQARYDLYMGFNDADAAGVEEVEARGGGEAYNCPFCGEDFDFVAFCCHVDDEHAVEAKSGAKSPKNIFRVPFFVVFVEKGLKRWQSAVLSWWIILYDKTAERYVTSSFALSAASLRSLFATIPLAEPSLSEKDQKERAQRSKFVRGLVLSTIFEDDNL
uniref:Drought induced 19 protein type zinc-binding domain-containing protein n=1 Tax=Oryza nivara TaxID=4536 RepID=A0A0E0HDA0_ORYNI